MQHRRGQPIAIVRGSPGSPVGPIEQDCQTRRLAGRTDSQVDLEVGQADTGVDREPFGTQLRGDVVPVPIDRLYLLAGGGSVRSGRQQRRSGVGGGVGRRVADAVFGQLKIGAQVLDADRGGLLDAQVLGIERAEDHDPAAGSGDRDIESALAAGAVERAEVQRQDARRGLGEAGGEDDDVALVSLDVLEVLDEQPVLPADQAVGDALVVELPEQLLDEGALLEVERHDADRPLPVVPPAADLVDDGRGFDRVGAQRPCRQSPEGCWPPCFAGAAVERPVDSGEGQAGVGHLAGEGGEGGEPVVVVVTVAEGDERLVLAAVVPGQPQPVDPGMDELGEDRLLVGDDSEVGGSRLRGGLGHTRAVAAVGAARARRIGSRCGCQSQAALVSELAFVPSRFAETARRHLFGVAGDDGSAGSAQRSHGVGHGDLRRLVEHDEIEVDRARGDEPGQRVGADQDTGGELADDFAEGLDQPADRQAAASAPHLALKGRDGAKARAGSEGTSLHDPVRDDAAQGAAERV